VLAACSQVIGLVEEVGVVGWHVLQAHTASTLLHEAHLVEVVMVVGDLVGVLAQGRYLDGAGPVGVHERHAEGHILDHLLGHVG